VIKGQDGMLVYDGDCGFCTTAANWIAGHWPDNGPTAIPWQHLPSNAIAGAGLSHDDMQRSAWWIDDHTREEGSRAVARALDAAGGLWAIVGWLLVVPPISSVAPLGYRAVARHRHRFPGGTPACKV
jgi:predicted DCC family thiol-disulfide oxidoreductase YuxK